MPHRWHRGMFPASAPAPAATAHRQFGCILGRSPADACSLVPARFADRPGAPVRIDFHGAIIARRCPAASSGTPFVEPLLNAEKNKPPGLTRLPGLVTLPAGRGRGKGNARLACFKYGECGSVRHPAGHQDSWRRQLSQRWLTGSDESTTWVSRVSTRDNR